MHRSLELRQGQVLVSRGVCSVKGRHNPAMFNVRRILHNFSETPAPATFPIRIRRGLNATIPKPETAIAPRAGFSPIMYIKNSENNPYPLSQWKQRSAIGETVPSRFVF